MRRCGWSRGARDGYLITPSGVPYERMHRDDIVWFGIDDDPEPGGQTPRARTRRRQAWPTALSRHG
jgi:ribulose-5-phosphate 4-epimerase/fuculose-1-phosphate aldolase